MAAATVTAAAVAATTATATVTGTSAGTVKVTATSTDTAIPTASAAATPRVSTKAPPGKRTLIPKASIPQLRSLLEAIENDPTLYNASNSELISFLNFEKWIDLADKLNALGGRRPLSVSSWKYILNRWSENTRNKIGWQKTNPGVSAQHLKDLIELETRLYAFMEREQAREIADVTYSGTMPDGRNKEDMKFVVQLFNVFPAKQDENTNPCGAKKRTIIMKDDNPSADEVGVKKFKIFYNQNVGEGEDTNMQIVGYELDRLQLVSRELEENISTIQNRIHMIKDLWKYRCGDN